MSELKFDQGAVGIAPASVAGNGHAVETAAENGRLSSLAERNLSYWRQKLAGIPAILELPTDRPRPPAQSFRAAEESVLLPANLKQELEQLSQREGVSLYVVLLAAFQALLARYTRQDDIVTGVAVPEAVAIRSDFTGDPKSGDLRSGDLRFRELLARVSHEVAEAREHQNVAWERVVEAVEPDRDASRHPVFQAQFLLEENSEFAKTSFGIADSDIHSLNSNHDSLPVDLSLLIQNQPEGLAAHFTYATDLFDASTIARMAGHFTKLLEGVVANPEETVSRLALLTEAERQQLVIEWNQTEMQYARESGVHQLFAAQAARTPKATAVVFAGQSLTYSELDRRSNQLARHLIQLGAKPDGLIAICLERSLEMVVGLLGILKAGSAYVPLDPAYPRDRVAFMLENSEAPLIVTQASLKENLPASHAKVVLIDADWPAIAKQSEASPALALDPANRAYVIYTSGSTGKPKGVEIPHRAVVNFLTTMAKQPGMTAGDRLLAVTTLCFDIAGLEIYLPLTQGASLEIVSREVASDGNQLLKKLKSSEASVMQATPATWRMLLEAGWTGDPRLKILIGGEAVSQKLVGQLIERSASVWNVYGPTETTIWSTLSQLYRDTPVTIGRPIGNTEIFILDKVLQPVPIGVAGELHIGGDGLARGYLKRPELTAEKFIQHPVNSDPGARLYKTGDLVRYLPNGNIEFLGRIDHQIKIRGFRIELGEIETVLRQHPAISDTVVVAREDTPGDKRVVAYFVSVGEAVLTTAELRSFLKEKLPEYMLPSVFVTLKSMPLTPNGKVDRRALPAPDQASLAPTGTFAAPKDEVETQLVQIWENLLNVRPIGVKDNYFELGGHSLVAVRVMNRIEQVFGKSLPIATLLQAPTIEQLAAILRKDGKTPAWSCLVPIQTTGSKSPFFCIHGINGAVIRFYDLSKYLGPDQPFYGLQAQGLEPSHACHTTTEEMAAHYIELIRAVQPQGPYFLGGYSFGGAIAFEMAQQLAAAGVPETTVVLFDTNFTGPASAVPDQSAWSALSALFRVPSSERWDYLGRMITWPRRSMQRRIRLSNLPAIVKKVRNACIQAELDYKPRPYNGRVILFRSTHKPMGQLSDPRAGWDKCAVRGLEICEVSGNHENILLEPQVRSVAGQLKACLDADETNVHPVSGTRTPKSERTAQ
jgi:amino acid adenylation domain-containing protein